jgi:hypothetical protein
MLLTPVFFVCMIFLKYIKNMVTNCSENKSSLLVRVKYPTSTHSCEDANNFLC